MFNDLCMDGLRKCARGMRQRVCFMNSVLVVVRGQCGWSGGEQHEVRGYRSRWVQWCVCELGMLLIVWWRAMECVWMRQWSDLMLGLCMCCTCHEANQ